MSRFFIDRPVFAWVIAILIMLGGLLALRTLPIAQYPQIAPTTVRITGSYPGADAQTVENSVTKVIEQGMTGIDNLDYMTSTSTSTGEVTITLTFTSAADPDVAQMQVQNKLQLVQSQLPSVVQTNGLSVDKASDSFLMVIAFVSKDGRMSLLGAVLLASVLGGCAVGPDYEAPVLMMPATWGASSTVVATDGKDAAAAKPPQLGRWWERLNDKALNRLVEEAVAGNLDVATAKARVRQARATYQQAVGGLFPTATGSGSYTRGQDGSNVSSSGDVTVSGPYDSYQFGLNASWELDLFGANRRAAEAAKYGLDASEESLRNTLLTLVGDVATYYAEARGYQARIDLAQRTATSQRETAVLTRTKLQAGSASAVDVANAEGQAASTEANIPALRSSYQQAVNRLSILLGAPPSTLNAYMRKSAPIPVPRLPIPKGVPANVLVSRPDVRMAERQLAQYTAQVGEAQAALYPDVSLAGSIDTSGTKFGDLGKSSSISWSFGPSVTVPIFNAGQLQAAVEYAQAQRDQYFLAYRSAVLTALEDVENAMVALQQGRIQSRSLAASASSYRQAASLSRSLYQAGATSFLEVLDAERSLYTAEDSYLESRVSIATQYVSLNKALGGGWDGAVDSRTPEITDDMGPRFVKADWAKHFMKLN